MPWCMQSSALRRFWCYQPPSSIAIYPSCARVALARAGQKRDPGLETAGIWRMSDNVPTIQAGTSDDSQWMVISARSPPYSFVGAMAVDFAASKAALTMVSRMNTIDVAPEHGPYPFS